MEICCNMKMEVRHIAKLVNNQNLILTQNN